MHWTVTFSETQIELSKLHCGNRIEEGKILKKLVKQ